MTEVEKELISRLSKMKDFDNSENFTRIYEILTGKEAKKINLRTHGPYILKTLFNACKIPGNEEGKNECLEKRLIKLFKLLHDAGINCMYIELTGVKAKVTILQQFLNTALQQFLNTAPSGVSEKCRQKLVEIFLEQADYYNLEEKKEILSLCSQLDVEYLKLLKKKEFDLSLSYGISDSTILSAAIHDAGRLLDDLSRKLDTGLNAEAIEAQRSKVHACRDKIKYLLNNGCSPSKDREAMRQALLSYILEKRESETTALRKEIISTLAEYGGRIRGTCAAGEFQPLPYDVSVLCIKSSEDYKYWTACVEKMKGLGIDIDEKDEQGRTSFLYCLATGKYLGAYYLMTSGADASLKTDNIDPLFHLPGLLRASAGEDSFEIIFNKIILPRHQKGKNVLKKDVLGRNFIDLLRECADFGDSSLSGIIACNRLLQYASDFEQKIKSLGYKKDRDTCSVCTEYFAVNKILDDVYEKDNSEYLRKELLKRNKGGDNFLTYLFKNTGTIDDDSGMRLRYLIKGVPYFYLLCNDYDMHRQSPAYCALQYIAKHIAGISNRNWQSQKIIFDEICQAAALLIKETDKEHLSAASLATGKNCRDLSAEILSLMRSIEVTDDKKQNCLALEEALREKDVDFSLYGEKDDHFFEEMNVKIYQKEAQIYGRERG